jgi:hypothetical protein
MIIGQFETTATFFFSRSYEDMRDESAIFFITRIVRVTGALLFAANSGRRQDRTFLRTNDLEEKPRWQ